MSLASEESLIIKKTVGEGNAGGVTEAGSAEVGDGGGAEGGVVGEDAEEEIIEKRGEQGGGAELVAQVEGERALQGGVREDCGVEIAGQSRLRFGVYTSLGFDLGPHPFLLFLRPRRRRRRRGVAEFSGRHSRCVWLGFAVANVGKPNNVVLGGKPSWGRFGLDMDAPSIQTSIIQKNEFTFHVDFSDSQGSSWVYHQHLQKQKQTKKTMKVWFLFKYNKVESITNNIL